MTTHSSSPRKRGSSQAKIWVPAFAGMTICLLLAAPLLADSGLPPAQWANQQLPDPRQEAQAKALMEELRCLVCQGQSIADSDAELAGDMRAMVRARVAAGEKPEAIRQWLIDRYGQWVSYKPLVERYGAWVSYRPPSAPVAWPLWAAPLLLLGAGLVLLARRVRLK